MDTIRVGTHCFGSREGYRTIARSVDVTDAEDAELGGFGFGQSADLAFLESLEREPSAFGRPLTGGRVAVSRIFQGDPDEAGRATLEIRTILVAAPDMVRLAKAGLGAILQLPGLWKREAFRRGTLREILVPLELATPGPNERVAAARLFDAWSNAVLPERLAPGEPITLVPAEARPVIVAEPESLGSAAIASLAAQLPAPDLERLRWGVRLVSTAGPVDLCTLAPAGRSGGRRAAQRVRLDEANSSPRTDQVDRPLALARVAAERSWVKPDDAVRRGILRPIGFALAALIGLLAIAWITWIWIFAALERDPVASSDSLLASSPAVANEPSDRAERTVPAATSPTTDSLSEPDSDRSPPPVVEPVVTSDPARPDAESNGVDATENEDSAAPGAGESDGSASEDSSEPVESSQTVDEVAPPAGGSSDSVAPVEGEPTADSSPPDPCEECAALSGRFAELAEDARRAEAFRDRAALEAAARGYAEALRSIGLCDFDADLQPGVMARVRDRPGTAASMPADWPRWRELICRLEALQAALTSLDAVTSRLAGRGAVIRQDLMRLRKESTWILGSERADANSLREALTRLRRNLASDCLAAPPSREDQPQVEAIHAWLLLDPGATPGGGEGRFDPPGGPARSEMSP